jgi:ABC-type phosphate transport system substrate-binding protein
MCLSDSLNRGGLLRCSALSKSGSGAQTGAKIPQRPATHDAETADGSEDRDTIVDAKILEKWLSEVNGAGGHCRAEKVVAGKEGGGVLRIGNGNVDKKTLDDEVAADSEDDDTKKRHDPVYVVIGGPGKDIQANRQA